MVKPDLYVVKRYANRKLYDTVKRRFTTLDDVAHLLESGVKVVIRDHDTGADRTDELLAQVLGRRVARTAGGSDLIAGLLRTPAKVALEVADSLGTTSGSPGPVVASVDVDEDDEPARKPKKAKTKSAKSQQPDKPKAKKKPKADDADAQVRRQQKEIRELRDQVSQLTHAVTLLLQEKTDALEAETADEEE